jgi:1-deoxy-D-xylulose-5-phosphate reductoisomerase
MTGEKITNVLILGSTGSIGKQALEVIDKHTEKFRVVGLAARDEVSLLAEQIEKYKPLAVAVSDDRACRQLRDIYKHKIAFMSGIEGLQEIASLPEADIVLIAVSGAIGILPTLAAIEANKKIALANKETLVAAGEIVMAKAYEKGILIIPVDSEHSAIFQCIKGEEKYLKNIWLTASGGPFRDFSREELEKVNPGMALRHPNWAMGPKITVDSATLMNKGLEVIEAYHLFGLDYDRIKVLVQKESIIHSMVELVDGSFLAHLGVPDMRIPIQYAFTYPERFESPAQNLDFASLASINFARPDTEKFPALALAYNAGRIGGTMPTVLNAANEVAVNCFLNGKIKFTAISSIVEEVMLKHRPEKEVDLDIIFNADDWARKMATELILSI